MRAAISALNVDPRVTGIILQRPVPSHLDLKYLQNAIHPDKDVEGMNAANIGNIVYGGSTLAPCTARASVALLKSTGLNLRGLEVVIVGHSEIVGKPIALQLDGRVRHGDHLPSRDAQPGDPYPPCGGAVRRGWQARTDHGRDGETRCGGHRHRHQPGGRTRIVGDVDFDSVVDVAGWITPVPGGVGPMTVAILLSNTVQAVERQRRSYEEAMAGGAPS